MGDFADLFSGDGFDFSKLFSGDVLTPIGMALLSAGAAQPYGGPGRLSAGGQGLMQGMQFVDQRRTRKEKSEYRKLLMDKARFDMEQSKGVTAAKQQQQQQANQGLADAVGVPWLNPDTGQTVQTGLATRGANGMDPNLAQLFQGQGGAEGYAGLLKAARQAIPKPRSQAAIPYGINEDERANISAIAESKRADPQPDRTLKQIYDPNSPTGTRWVPRAEAVGQPGKPGFGGSLTVGPEGGVDFQFGTGMGTKTENLIKGKLFKAKESLARYDQIAATFKPEWQELPTRMGIAWDQMRAKMGADISSEDRRTLTEFADFRRPALESLNQYISDITGAQVSQHEAGRLRKSVPDPGEGIWPADDPITFQAKLNSVRRDTQKATARYEYYLKRGITGISEIAGRTPLGSMDVAVNPQTGQRLVQIDGNWVPF